MGEALTHSIADGYWSIFVYFQFRTWVFRGFRTFLRLGKTFILFCIPLHTLFAQNAQLDSLERLFATEKAPEQRLELVSQMVNMAFMTNLEEALTYAKRGVALAEKTANKDWQPRFYDLEGRMHANLLQLDSATVCFDQAMAGYLAVGNKRGQATTCFKISWVFKKKGDIESAMKYDLAALKLMEELDDKLGIANAYERLSEDLNRQEKPKEALEYAQMAIKISEENALYGELVYALCRAGDAAISSGENEQALAYYERTLALAKSQKFGVTVLCDFVNSRGNALKRLGRYKEALADYEECLKMAEKINYPNAISTAIANLGETNLLLGNHSKALYYQLQTIRLQESNGDFTNLVENYQHVSKTYEALGDYPSALIFERKSRNLRDSLMTLESDAAMSELRTQYETEKKEATIALQQQQISSQRVVQWLSIGVVILLAGFLFFLYRSYRARLQTNQLLEAQNAEKELLLKEIHHRVKNNLEMVSSLLALQSAQIEDKGIKDAMLEGQNRVQSIGIVHQKLYQGKNLGAIEMKDYFFNLSESILNSFGAEDRVEIECMMDTLDMDIDSAVPLGLIVNELLTNTLKYAFPDGRKGSVRIQLEEKKEGILHMVISDNGVGKSSVIQGTGFGGQLVALLTRQLQGSMWEEVKNGTTIFFDFNLKSAV
ncbi:MAG: histidine kinase dimerization/phosphoacceptor domain -containing protein [Bacteroidia bacterium]